MRRWRRQRTACDLGGSLDFLDVLWRTRVSNATSSIGWRETWKTKEIGNAVTASLDTFTRGVFGLRGTGCKDVATFPCDVCPTEVFWLVWCCECGVC